MPVTVHRRDRSTTRVFLGELVQEGDKVDLYRFRSVPDRKAASRSTRSRCRECGGPLRDSAHHRAMEGYCGSCAFDEFDM